MARPGRTTERKTWRRLLGRVALAAAACAAAGAAAGDGRPGQFDYYALTLSWSPTYCETEARGSKEPQCAGPRPYAFVLHGLWPQFEKGWPGNCDIGKRPWVPEAVIDGILDIMPARGLVIHQYRKHGTCSGLSPQAYYETARRLFERIAIPARYLAPRRSLTVTPGRIEADFLKTNPELRPEMISIACDRKHLREVRICFSRALEPRACGENERQSRLCRAETITMPPVRGR